MACLRISILAWPIIEKSQNGFSEWTVLTLVMSIVLSLLGALLGVGSGIFIYEHYIPWWSHHEITPLKSAKDILHIDIRSFLDEPTNDVLYVASEDGDTFSIALFQDQWYPVETVPENDYEYPHCATEWTDNPPVASGIIDSAGVRFERPLSTILRCYVLYNDGNLQVWTLFTDAFGLMRTVLISGGIGLIIGVIVSVLVWHKIRSPQI